MNPIPTTYFPRYPSERKLLSALALAGSLCWPSLAHRDDASLGAVTNEKLLLNLLAHYEYVEESNKSKETNAFTVHTFLGRSTKPWMGLLATI
jgi:hypothetical protein